MIVFLDCLSQNYPKRKKLVCQPVLVATTGICRWFRVGSFIWKNNYLLSWFHWIGNCTDFKTIWTPSLFHCTVLKATTAIKWWICMKEDESFLCVKDITRTLSRWGVTLIGLMRWQFTALLNCWIFTQHLSIHCSACQKALQCITKEQINVDRFGVHPQIKFSSARWNRSTAMACRRFPIAASFWYSMGLGLMRQCTKS